MKKIDQNGTNLHDFWYIFMDVTFL